MSWSICSHLTPCLSGFFHSSSSVSLAFYPRPSSSAFHLHCSFLVFLSLFPTLQNLFPCPFGFLPCVYFAASFSRAQTENHKHQFVIQKANTSLSIFLILPEAWLADVNRHKHAGPATAYLTCPTVQRSKSG